MIPEIESWPVYMHIQLHPYKHTSVPTCTHPNTQSRKTLKQMCSLTNCGTPVTLSVTILEALFTLPSLILYKDTATVLAHRGLM